MIDSEVHGKETLEEGLEEGREVIRLEREMKGGH